MSQNISEGVTNHQLTSSVLKINSQEGEDDVVETDPTGRFERYRKSLGIGAYKEVFKAFDQEEGVEVAWNQIRINSLTKPDITRIHTEIQIMQSLRNENIINLLYSWRAPSSVPEKDDIFFITEFMSSGSLKGYIRRTKGMIKPKIIRNWCKQILNGLNYLHTRENPIIHRDLKCENIFINGNNGQAKIGDLGLAVVKATQHLSSVLGTPEFMAPELYDELYDEKVDIYAFGMVVLEIATKEYPYSECSNQAQIFRKVTNGIKPAALSQVADEEIRAFIDVCIEHDPKKRPSATELLNHPFFYLTNGQSNRGGSFVDLTSLDMASSSSGSIPGASNPSNIIISENLPQQPLSTESLPSLTQMRSTLEVESDQHHFYVSQHSAPLKPTVTCDVEAIGPVNEDEVTLKMVHHTGTSSCEIKFPFNLTDDTATDVVSELVKENLVLVIDEQLTRRKIEEAVRGVLMKQRLGQKSNSELSISKTNENTQLAGNPSEAKNIPDFSSNLAKKIVESPQIECAIPSQPSNMEQMPERKISTPASSSVSPIPIHHSTIPIHQPMSQSPSVDESLLNSLDLQSISRTSNSFQQISPANSGTDSIPNVKPATNISSSIDSSASDRQREISQKLTELQEANLKNFDVSAAASSRSKSSSNPNTINVSPSFKATLSLN